MPEFQKRKVSFGFNNLLLVVMSIELDKTMHHEILYDIERIERDEALYRDKNFVLRLEAIDDIEVNIIDRIDALTKNTTASDLLVSLKQSANKVKHRLEEQNRMMFQQLRVKISKEVDKGKLLHLWMDEYLHDHINPFQQDSAGYDYLDIFLNPPHLSRFTG